MSVWVWIDPGNLLLGTPGLPNFNLPVRYSSSAPGSDQMTLQKNFQYELQPASSGQYPLMFEGYSQPTSMVLTGLVLTQLQLKTLIQHYYLEHLTTLIDDREMTRTIYATGLTYTRINSALFPWRSSFQLTAMVFGFTIAAFPAVVLNPAETQEQNWKT